MPNLKFIKLNFLFGKYCDKTRLYQMQPEDEWSQEDGFDKTIWTIA